MVHPPSYLRLRHKLQVSPCYVKLLLNRKVAFTPMRKRQSIPPIASYVSNLVRNKAERTYHLSGYYTDMHQAKSALFKILH